jgi:hypothetical protein
MVAIIVRKLELFLVVFNKSAGGRTPHVDPYHHHEVEEEEVKEEEEEEEESHQSWARSCLTPYGVV